MEEEWREISEFPNYIINKHGYICNKNRLEKPICGWKDNLGYKMVQLKKDKKKYYRRAYRLVAIAFIPNPLNLPMVNHMCDDRYNCDVENLEWCTNSYNTQYTYDKGGYVSTYKVDVKAIHKQTKQEYVFRSIREMSKELNLNRKTITSILKGIKTTNNYEYDFEYIKN